VRGFELDARACEEAAFSLAELRASSVLRTWANYREVGSVILLPPGPLPDKQLDIVDSYLPGSLSTLDAEELAKRYPFQGLPEDQAAVAERHAGYLSPRRLREAVLADLAGSVRFHQVAVESVTPHPSIVLADGTRRRYDAVVLATGAWTPRLLARSGFPDSGMRTKQIQYTVCPAILGDLGSFGDARTGLYGRPAAAGFLLGMHCDRWDIDPDDVSADLENLDKLGAEAKVRLGIDEAIVRSGHTVVSFDCFSADPGLRLRTVTPGLFTFTGGSGAAAKTVLAASRTAASKVRAHVR
jgi:glycine/D-amino acid oxidase-like deaminating enzyme